VLPAVKSVNANKEEPAFVRLEPASVLRPEDATVEGTASVPRAEVNASALVVQRAAVEEIANVRKTVGPATAHPQPLLPLPAAAAETRIIKLFSISTKL